MIRIEYNVQMAVDLEGKNLFGVSYRSKNSGVREFGFTKRRSLVLDFCIWHELNELDYTLLLYRRMAST